MRRLKSSNQRVPAVWSFAVGPSNHFLALLGVLRARILLPHSFSEPAQMLRALVADQGESDARTIGFIIGVGVVTGAALGAVIALKRSRGNAVSRTNALGDIEALLPRNCRERWWAALISINAGFSEELFFRVLLPLLLYRVFGNVFAALGISILVFGCVHVYQGWKGVVATTVVGALFTAVYLGSGQIGFSMLLHAVMDLNALLLMPAVRRKPLI